MGVVLYNVDGLRSIVRIKARVRTRVLRVVHGRLIHALHEEATVVLMRRVGLLLVLELNYIPPVLVFDVEHPLIVIEHTDGEGLVSVASSQVLVFASDRHVLFNLEQLRQRRVHGFHDGLVPAVPFVRALF